MMNINIKEPVRFDGYVHISEEEFAKWPKPTIVDASKDPKYSDILDKMNKESGIESMTNTIIAQLKDENRKLRESLKVEETLRKAKQLNAYNACLECERKSKYAQQIADLEVKNGNLKREVDDLRNKNSKLCNDKIELDKLKRENEAYSRVNSDLCKDYNCLKRDYEGLQTQYDILLSETEKSNSDISTLEYESLRDKAMEMARLLKKIDKEAHECAMCKGDRGGQYSTDCFLKTVCEILYSSEGNYNSKEFAR